MIAIISGSSRPNNNTYKVANAMAKLIQQHHNVKANVIDFKDYDLPFFNQGMMQSAHLSAFQSHLYEQCANAKLIIVISPEYNWFPSAELFQMVNVFGSGQYIDMWKGKVFAMCGVSSGRGGRLPAVYLMELYNKIIHVLNAQSVVSPKLLECPVVDQGFSKDASLLSPSDLEKAMLSFIQYNWHLAQSFGA
jgi:chromate reductase